MGKFSAYLEEKKAHRQNRHRKILTVFCVTIIVIILIVRAIGTWVYHKNTRFVSLETLWRESSYIHVVKSDYKLFLFNDRWKFFRSVVMQDHSGNIKQYRVAIGKNPGDKQYSGDMRTPQGLFLIEEFHDARTWEHDFGDGKGNIKNAYGPWFMELRTGWEGIGIHGTHDNKTLGTMDTEGCVRLRNNELVELKSLVHINTPVYISP